MAIPLSGSALGQRSAVHILSKTFVLTAFGAGPTAGATANVDALQNDPDYRESLSPPPPALTRQTDICPSEIISVSASNAFIAPPYVLEYVLVCDGTLYGPNTTGSFDLLALGINGPAICTVYAVNHDGAEDFSTWPTPVAACASFLEREITVLALPAGDISETICAGDSTTINGVDYYSVDGIYTDTISGFNCDSVVTLTLTVNSTDAVTLGATSCDPAEVGITVDSLTNAAGCDSVVTTITTLSPSYNFTFNSTTCNPANAGSFTDSLQTLAGCDSVINTVVVLTTYDSTGIALTTCDPALAGTVVDTFTNAIGCDSIVTTLTTLLNGGTFTVNQSTCDPDEVGTEVDTLLSSDGCDSIVTIITTGDFGSPITSCPSGDPAVCWPLIVTGTNHSILMPDGTLFYNGLPLPVGSYVGVFYDDGGVERCGGYIEWLGVYTSLAAFGDDPGGPKDGFALGELFRFKFLLPNGDVVNDVVPQFEPVNPPIPTATDTYIGFGISRLEQLSNEEGSCPCTVGIDTTIQAVTCDPLLAGVVTDSLESSEGCDSVVTTITTLLPSYSLDVFSTTCDPANAGTTVDSLQTLAGCDSVITTVTTLSLYDSTGIVLITCDPDLAGVTTDTLENSSGCDSLVTTITTLLPSYDISFSSTSCDPANAGTSIDSLQTFAGCDSIITTVVTLAAYDSTGVVSTTCDNTMAGTTTEVFVNTAGCDSLVTQVVLYVPADSSGILLTTCDPLEAGAVTEIFINQEGCDSLITTLTTLLPSDDIQLQEVTCDPDSAGIFTLSLTNRFGCDSTVTTTVTLGEESSVDVGQVVVCDSANINGQWFFTSQNITYVLPSTAGCDSTVTLSLVIDICATAGIDLPNIFTPNGDGENDIFYAYTDNILANYSMKVFDRWGEKVFESEDINVGWNGEFRGVPMNIGVFVVVVEARFLSGGSSRIIQQVKLLR